MVSYLITGTNRGIGFELVKQLAANPKNVVFATVRTSDKLKTFDEYSNVHTFALASDAKFEVFRDSLKFIDKYSPNGIDVVIHNAGISGQGAQFLHSKEQDIDSYSEMFEVNTASLVKLYRAVIPYLFKTAGETKKFIYISSSAGSLSMLDQFPFAGFNAYGMSKAAGNYFMKQIARENLKETDEIYNTSVSLSIQPGTVATDMGTPVIESGLFPKENFITPAESASNILECVSKADRSISGRLMDADGTMLTL